MIIRTIPTLPGPCWVESCKERTMTCSLRVFWKTITHTLPLSDALRAFEIAADKGQSMKTQIEFAQVKP